MGGREYDKILKETYTRGMEALMGAGRVTFEPRMPTKWQNHTFKVPRKCHFCNGSLWGKGRIGYVNWTYDTDVFRAHTECQVLGVLGGND